ncbi:C40 family peptidase [Aquincola sp. MAHUQ-54]|uniref:C40 family peptidase n=1 Tax=Aquincola agrisoli TaxID=3119538 RepID=A0AAW9QFP4_9BURK
MAWFAVTLGGAVTSTYAAPDAPAASASSPAPDSVTTLLIERGLLPASSAAVVQSVRDKTSDLVVSAMNFLGVPYRRGGTSEEGFDCSGFTRHIFEMSIGRVLPRRADEQAKSPDLFKVAREELKPGDLVFFNTMRRTFSHVGIYLGENKFIHAPRPGGEVRIEDMGQSYWAKRFTGARRAPEVDGFEQRMQNGLQQLRSAVAPGAADTVR